MSNDSAVTTQTAIEALPFLPRTADSAWTRAAQIRDELLTAIEGALAAQGIRALVHRSVDFIYPTWVIAEAWLPVASGATDRVWMRIEIAPQAYAKHPIEYTVVVTQGPKTRRFGPMYRLNGNDAAAWALHAMRRGPRPAWRMSLLRRYPWEIWLPRNKPADLQFDWVNVVVWGLFIGGFVTLGLGIGVFAIAAAGIILFVRNRRRVVLSPGRPAAEPRTLGWADSWHIVLRGLGPRAGEVRERMKSVLSTGAPTDLRLREERITYVTPDGKQERDQIVLSQGRGLLFCHVYAYGEDLFIGWDAHVNYGHWKETRVATGYSDKAGRLVYVHSVEPAVAAATEYDLIDLNSLIEATHARVSQVVRQVAAEHKIDQEIDFKIVRGDRQSLLKREEQASAGGSRLLRRAG